MPDASNLSRRGLLLAGLAGAAAPVVTPRSGGGAWRAGAVSALPLVQPIASQRAYEAFGVCAHPHFDQSGYKYTRDWMSALASVGARYFRGLYAHQHFANRTTTELARENGIKWGATVCPDLFFPDSDLAGRIRHIASNAADVCLFIEGVNEPNNVRGWGSPPPPDWPQRTVAKQRVIWETVRSEPRLSHVHVVGPSLHASLSTESDHRRLRDAGLVRYMDFAGLHRYPGGRYPDHLLDQRLSWIKRYWSGKPAWITETGYTNALHHREKEGHAPVPEDVSAVYAPAALLEALDRGCKVSWYELLDDPDPLAKDDIESNFGMFATAFEDAPPWRAKPVVSTMRAFLARLDDPGPPYRPARIGLRVSSEAKDVRATVTGRRDGAVTLHVRRAANCWDPAARQRIPVAPVPVVVETARGSMTLVVDHNVQSIPLRT
jgi:hypothetical protein